MRVVSPGAGGDVAGGDVGRYPRPYRADAFLRDPQRSRSARRRAPAKAPRAAVWNGHRFVGPGDVSARLPRAMVRGAPDSPAEDMRTGREDHDPAGVRHGELTRARSAGG